MPTVPPLPPLLVALTVTLEVPATAGVPEIRPVEVLTARPAVDRTHRNWLVSWKR